MMKAEYVNGVETYSVREKDIFGRQEHDGDSDLLLKMYKYMNKFIRVSFKRILLEDNKMIIDQEKSVRSLERYLEHNISYEMMYKVTVLHGNTMNEQKKYYYIEKICNYKYVPPRMVTRGYFVFLV